MNNSPTPDSPVPLAEPLDPALEPESPPPPTARVNYKSLLAHPFEPLPYKFLADIPEAPIPWLWTGFIPRGAVTLLVGDQAVGKSFLALDIAARLSRGHPLPAADAPAPAPSAVVAGLPTEPPRPTGGLPPAVPATDLRPPAATLYLAADDALRWTIRPRLVAMHADLARIATLPRYVRQPRFIDPPRHLSLAHDFRRIQDVARQIPDLGLIVLDPLTAYLDGVRAYSQAEVRTLLWHLSLLAQESGLAVLAVTHFRKDAAASVLHRTLGSLAFTTAVRVVLALFKDPAVAGRRLLLPAKMNVIPDAAGRAFTIEDGRLAWEPDPVPLTAQDLSDLTAHGRARAERLAEAARWARRPRRRPPHRRRSPRPRPRRRQTLHLQSPLRRPPPRPHRTPPRRPPQPLALATRPQSQSPMTIDQ
jgi:hypothetical protein